MDVLSIFALILGVVGILGGIVPGIPGPAVSWVALLCAYFSSSMTVSGTSLLIWFVVMAAVTVLDFVLPGKVAAMTGGHKSAERGALIGLVVGMFLTPVGMLLGCFIGALLGEMMIEGQDVYHSLKAALGAFVGVIVATGIKVVASVILMWILVSDFF